MPCTLNQPKFSPSLTKTERVERTACQRDPCEARSYSPAAPAEEKADVIAKSSSEHGPLPGR